MLEKVIGIEPDHTPAHVLLARLYFKLKRTADAEREQQTVARLNDEQQKANLKRHEEHQMEMPRSPQPAQQGEQPRAQQAPGIATPRP
jgi:hypothetical protein